jgi:deazaflavin-dependent oxidoreductase (nitroreductase family)
MADWRQRLAAVKSLGTARITTTGRRTGKPHTVPIWFAAGDDGRIYLGTLKMGRDWPKNVKKTPEIEIQIGDVRLRGRASIIEDAGKREGIERLLASKYLVARIGSWFGLKPQGVFEVEVTGEAG